MPFKMTMTTPYNTVLCISSSLGPHPPEWRTTRPGSIKSDCIQLRHIDIHIYIYHYTIHSFTRHPSRICRIFPFELRSWHLLQMSRPFKDSLTRWSFQTFSEMEKTRHIISFRLWQPGNRKNVWRYDHEMGIGLRLASCHMRAKSCKPAIIRHCDPETHLQLLHQARRCSLPPAKSAYGSAYIYINRPRRTNRSNLYVNSFWGSLSQSLRGSRILPKYGSSVIEFWQRVLNYIWLIF